MYYAAFFCCVLPAPVGLQFFAPRFATVCHWFFLSVIKRAGSSRGTQSHRTGRSVPRASLGGTSPRWGQEAARRARPISTLRRARFGFEELCSEPRLFDLSHYTFYLYYSAWALSFSPALTTASLSPLQRRTIPQSQRVLPPGTAAPEKPRGVRRLGTCGSLPWSAACRRGSGASASLPIPPENGAKGSNAANIDPMIRPGAAGQKEVSNRGVAES